MKKIKWPKSVTLIRHGESAYNALSRKKNGDESYQKFKEEYEKDSKSKIAINLAQEMEKKYSLGTSDYGTPLTIIGQNQSFVTGQNLSEIIYKPDVIMVSPYLRTIETLNQIIKGWPDIKNVPQFPDERIREQEHGLSLLYNDWRIFNVLHPEQKKLYELLGPYWYQFPQGESVAEVRERCRDEVAMLIREFANKHVLLITHHLTILSFRSNLERLSPEEFIELDEKFKPKNCGITKYCCNNNVGENGRLELEFYNRILY
jgi:broad specificity phosphatase PhoE